ncbi:Cellulose synthase-like protein E1 [Capsicum chinense]|nr:Cellulose synthase-like protein E1 [Capsicum chinense]
MVVVDFGMWKLGVEGNFVSYYRHDEMYVSILASVRYQDFEVIGMIQILIDSRDEEMKDIDGVRLLTFVYVAQEKHPQHFHNFKAGAMNMLASLSTSCSSHKVSSKISNGPVILNVDCDMYSNNSDSIQDALCFFMDEEKRHEIVFVQFPQSFENTIKNELYGSLRIGPSLLVHSTTLTNMANPDSYKKIHIESLRKLQRQFDELQRDLADFGTNQSDATDNQSDATDISSVTTDYSCDALDK